MNSRTTDPITSRIAGENHERSGKAASHRALCLQAVIQNPLRTAAEIAVIAGLERHEASRRLPELEHEKKIEKSGKRICTVTGNLSCVWDEVFTLR